MTPRRWLSRCGTTGTANDGGCCCGGCVGCNGCAGNGAVVEEDDEGWLLLLPPPLPPPNEKAGAFAYRGVASGDATTCERGVVRSCALPLCRVVVVADAPAKPAEDAAEDWTTKSAGAAWGVWCLLLLPTPRTREGATRGVTEPPPLAAPFATDADEDEEAEEASATEKSGGRAPPNGADADAPNPNALFLPPPPLLPCGDRARGVEAGGGGGPWRPERRTLPLPPPETFTAVAVPLIRDEYDETGSVIVTAAALAAAWAEAAAEGRNGSI